MDFHSLSRRELQALCKKNRIPANVTNAAMAEALEALKLVEGIDDFMQTSQSGTAQSFAESLETPEVTSPFPPPTAGRSTRRTNIANKEAPESVNPTTRARRTTRKTQVKDADAIGTPASMAQTNRKKGQMASARRNMDSQLKECVDEDKKDLLMTPAPMESTSRRRRVGESAVNRVYSTRRSVRLAVKNNVEMVNEVENEESQVFKKESVAKDGDDEEMRDGVDNFNELPRILDVVAITTVEEESRNKDEAPEVSICKDEFEPDSDQRQEDTSVVEIVLEAVSDQKQDISTGAGIKIDSYAEENECTNFETGVKLEKEKCDNEEEDMSMDVQQNDGSQDVHIPETEEMKPEEGEVSQDEAADFVENAVLESGDNLIVGESSRDDTGFHDEINGEPYSVTLDKRTELILQQEATIQEADSDFINEPNESVTLQLKESDEAAVDPVPSEEPYADFSEQITEPGLEVEMTLTTGFKESEKMSDTVPSDERNESVTLQLKESEEAAVDPVPSEKSYADFSEQITEPGLDVEMTLTSGFKESEKLSDTVPSDERNADFSGQIAEFVVEGLDSSAGIIPSKKSDSCMAMKSRACMSDNKENIGCGSKLVVMKDVETSTDKLEGMSMRQLRKMLKQLEITKKPSKNKNEVEDEVKNKAMSRPALQAISENPLEDGTQN
ncbi:hypothetical protein OROGR_016120 [Orobanche gracilis]